MPENEKHYCPFATYLELNDGTYGFNTTGYRLCACSLTDDIKGPYTSKDNKIVLSMMFTEDTFRVFPTGLQYSWRLRYKIA